MWRVNAAIQTFLSPATVPNCVAGGLTVGRVTTAYNSTLSVRPRAPLVRASRPNGKLPQNAYIESFNGRFREACLNLHWFTTLAETKAIIEDWGRTTTAPVRTAR